MLFGLLPTIPRPIPATADPQRATSSAVSRAVSSSGHCYRRSGVASATTCGVSSTPRVCVQSTVESRACSRSFWSSSVAAGKAVATSVVCLPRPREYPSLVPADSSPSAPAADDQLVHPML